jgi:hypothetical protein
LKAESRGRIRNSWLAKMLMQSPGWSLTGNPVSVWPAMSRKGRFDITGALGSRGAGQADPRCRHHLRVRDGFPPIALGVLLLSLSATDMAAQVDPEPRRLIQAGYALPLHEHGPVAAYAFYYHNEPHFLQTNLTLRLAVMPIFVDSELGISEALSPHTDFALGLSGGGFADSFSEIRQGDYITGESFTGHSAELNGSIYHLFNPGDIAPLYGILRGGMHGSFYSRDSGTETDFEIPDDQGSFLWRAGFRLGGREPYLSPRLAGEFSLWYEGQYRLNHQRYGFAGDRQIEALTHLFWARALFAYTIEETRQHFEISLIAGAGVDADRFSAFRLGSFLPLVAEFPLSLPGYHIEEISADHFALLTGQFYQPIDAAARWNVLAFGSVGIVDYLPGFEQDGHWHGGFGAGVFYQTPSRSWQIGGGAAYGVNAIREDGRGAITFTLMIQYDLDKDLGDGTEPFWKPVTNTRTWQGLFRRLGAR